MIGKKALLEFFKISPTPSLVLLPDAPKFTIIDVNEAYLEATHSKANDLIGKGIFEAFPDNDSDPTADGVKNLSHSLHTVVQTNKKHKMAVQKYDIPIRGTSDFELKYWKPENIPLLSNTAELKFIIHCVTDVTESILSTKKIAESKIAIEKGNEILEQTEAISKLGRWELDLETRKVFWSDSNYVMIGYEPQEFEITFEKSFEIIHPDDRERVAEHFKEILETLEDYRIELRFVTKNNSIINVLSKAKFVFDQKGKPQKLVGILQDITEIKKAEETAKKAQQELQKVLDLSLDIICTMDSEGRFVKMNAASIATWGYTPEELIGKHFSDFVIPNDIEKSDKVKNEVLSGIDLTNFENTYIRKDGTLVPMIWSVRWQASEGIMYCVGIDATYIKKAETQAQERQFFIETVLENLPIGISINRIDDSKAIWMNKKFTEIYGWPNKILKDIPTFFEKVYPNPEYRKEITKRVMEDIKSGDENRMNWEEIIVTTQNNEQRIINAKNIPIYKQNLMISTVMDVTERIKTKKAIEESNERFEFVTKATFDAVWDWDIIADTIYWGDGFEKIFGYNLSAIKRNISGWMENIHPDDLERITQSYYAIVRSKETNWIEEYRYKKNNGQYSYVLNKGIVIRDKSGRAIRIIGAMQDITKKKEEELRLKLLESVITNTDDSILITEAEPFDEPGPKIVYVNEAFTKMTGYTSEEVIGKTPRILQGPKTDREELNKLSAALRQWQPYEVTLLNYKKTGEEFWIQMSINPVADATGWYTHWVAIERDVTKQKQEEERLKLLESVVTNTNDAVVIKEARPSSEGGRKIVYVNESFTRMSGYTPDEIIGKTHQLVQGANTNAEELKRFYEALDAWQPIEVTIINYNKEGKEYWVQLSLNPVTNDKGEYTHWISIERDVTERKNQEQKLKETTQTLSDTLESIQDGFYSLDANWNVTYWNKEAEKLSGKRYDEMIGKNFWELYDGSLSEKIHNAFYKAKSQKRPVRLEVFSKQLQYWFELNAYPSEMGLTVYFKNITDRKHTESKLKKMNRSLENNIKELAISNQELERFAYVASHDLQEPLRMVTSFLTQIEKRYEPVLDEKGKKYIFFAVDGARRMRQIILDLLEFSRIGKSETKLEEVDVNSIIEEIRLLYRKQIEDKNAQINYTELPKIKTHAAPIKQVFQNLISNALKYSKPDQSPIITISFSENATSWKFEIKDNGIGISQEYFDKIFIIFQRLHSKEEYSGTGMGLTITKKIIENLRGQIWLESEEGYGTTFYFTIPKK
ncbi:PAS domain S-box protein [Flavobacterium sp.]|uniref:PAS domain S-box protein n=1 Tax=Flavobacterium sp. TaxID=239 RepID=UPI002FDA9C1B